MGIRDKPIAPGSPWQNGFAERLIGSIRRECVDHVVVLGEAHLRRKEIPRPKPGPKYLQVV
jgi:transposase InsO family protein